ncbi:TVP38/TMEM64 family protein [Pontibacillus yanchengensis]|uniref:TVP38/TMEM64 family membrane protein n=1 Tax=Pontibacillus yanchengensis Y32 TaxID=1385514 RepID=A0A0A2T559_9BACI|nr:TVP38/TMEM64 family protein [Pontibacillus yanchengensis]KGP70892.1 hypothetical protein N782_21515 [Pontibacillus yanchengensis Y32]
MNSSLKSFLWKIIILLVVAGGMLFINKMFLHIKPDHIESWVENFGIWAPVVIILIFIIRPFTLIPLSIIAVACGLLFGRYMGTLYIVSGTVLGALLSLFVLRYFLGEIQINDEQKQNLNALKKDLEEHGFKSVLMIRLLPGVNFDLVTYICARVEVKWWKYTLATLVGTLPGSILFGFFGSSLLSLKPQSIIILSGLIVVLAGLALFMKQEIGKKYDVNQLKEETKLLKEN